MKVIEYKASYNGVLQPGGSVAGDPSEELIRVKARDINAGFTKALRKTNEPLGNGSRRELSRIEFWQVVS